MNYCGQYSRPKGLIFPNVEITIKKSEPEVTSLELRFGHEKNGPKDKYYGKLVAVNSPTNKEVVVAIEKDKELKQTKFSVKSPKASFETVMNVNSNAGDMNIKMDIPEVININVDAKFNKDKETNTRNNEYLVEYKFPDDPTTHTIKYKQRLGYNLKRSSKDKVAFFDYGTQMESSRRPYLNYRTNFQFKYRPLKLGQINIEFSHGEGFTKQYRFSRTLNLDVIEMKPLKLTGNTEVQLIATEFDVHYDLKSDLKLEGSKGGDMEFEVKVKGKDLSKRAIAAGDGDIEGKLELKNEVSPLHYKVKGELKLRNEEYAYESETKQTDGQNYEGKITIQTGKDKKTFVNHHIL